MSAFGYGRFMPSSKAQAPKLAAATAMQGQIDTAAQARADALHGQNMQAAGKLAQKGYGAYKDGMFDSMFQPATDLGMEAGANSIATDLGAEAGANMAAGQLGATAPIATDVAASGLNAGAQALVGDAAAAGAGNLAGATAAELAAAELATGIAGSATGAGVGTAAGAAAGAAAPAAAAAGLGGLGAAASTAFPPLAIALLASQLLG